MEEENTRKHYLRFERLYKFFGVKTDAEQTVQKTTVNNDCSLKSWRSERAKRRVVAE